MLTLTQSTIPVIGTIAEIFGYIMNLIFIFLDKFGIANIGFCIILFTIIAYLLMMPLTIRQQKFSKLSAVMNPEIQAIQKKYKDKKDQDSIMRMNQELKVVYEKYGTSPTGGCLQMFIQLPMIYALYQVIIKLPGYVPEIKSIFMNLVNEIYANDKYHDAFVKLSTGKIKGFAFKGNEQDVKNRIVDVLYHFGNKDWSQIPDGLTDLADKAKTAIHPLNNFFGLNLAESPMSIIKTSLSGDRKDILLFIAALMIPLLAGLTQFINTKLMPQQAVTDDNNSMAASLKTMNTVMPLMSVAFTFSFATGIGLYWIVGAVVRSIQQICINKYMDKVDINDLIKKNMEKINKKRAKQGLPPKQVSSAAKINVKSVEYDKKMEEKKNVAKENIRKSSEYYNDSDANPGSLKSKANMVKRYNEKSNKK